MAGCNASFGAPQMPMLAALLSSRAAAAKGACRQRRQYRRLLRQSWHLPVWQSQGLASLVVTLDRRCRDGLKAIRIRSATGIGSRSAVARTWCDISCCPVLGPSKSAPISAI